MAAILQSLLSVQSVALESNVSVLSVAAHRATASPSSSSTSSTSSSSTPSPTPTTTPTPTPTPMPSSTTSTSTTSRTPIVSLTPSSTSTATPVRKIPSAKKVTHPSTTSATHSASTTPVSTASKGTSQAAVIGVMVVLVIAGVVGLGFLVWKWRRQRAQRRRRAQSGIWLEGPSYLANTRDVESVRSLPTYIPAGAANERRKDQDEKQDSSMKNLPPPPKEYEEEFTPYSETSAFPLPPSTPNSFSPNFHHTAYPNGQANSALAYPSAADVYGGGQLRPESGPVLLYSTPRNQDYSFGAAPRARPASAMSSSPYPRVSQHLSVVTPSAPSSPAPPAYPTLPAPAVLPVSVPMSATRASSPVGSAGSVTASVPITHYTFPVIRTYIPSLLDELKVSMGDVVRVIKEYDDGWAYCERVGDPDGAAGVVPLECLDRSAPGRPPSTLMPPGLYDQGSWRASSRFSSFHIDFDAMHSSPVGS